MKCLHIYLFQILLRIMMDQQLFQSLNGGRHTKINIPIWQGLHSSIYQFPSHLLVRKEDSLQLEELFMLDGDYRHKLLNTWFVSRIILEILALKSVLK